MSERKSQWFFRWYAWLWCCSAYLDVQISTVIKTVTWNNRKLRKRKPAIQIFYHAWLEQSADVNHHVLVKLNNAPLPRTLVAEIDITVLAHPLELFKCGLDVEGIIVKKLWDRHDLFREHADVDFFVDRIVQYVSPFLKLNVLCSHRHSSKFKVQNARILIPQNTNCR